MYFYIYIVFFTVQYNNDSHNIDCIKKREKKFPEHGLKKIKRVEKKGKSLNLSWFHGSSFCSYFFYSFHLYLEQPATAGKVSRIVDVIYLAIVWHCSINIWEKTRK